MTAGRSSFDVISPRHAACPLGAALLLCLVLPGVARSDPYPRQPGIDVRHYRFELTLRDDTDEIQGVATVTVRLGQGGTTRVALDLTGRGQDQTGMTVESVHRGTQPLAFRHEADRLVIDLGAPAAAGEEPRLTIAYRGIPSDGLVIGSNRHGDRTFFADNFPDRAHNWIPTLDHPSDKATCEFVLTVPSRYQAIASGVLVEETSLPGDRRLTHWRESVPISTYLMVVGVARFAVQYLDTVREVPIQTWVYPQDREQGFFDFARTGRALEFFSQRIGPFPYEKLANVQTSTRYGGMENAGNIFYAERAVNGSRRIENTVVHEVAHQWFGDAVTEADWNHVWLSEGFATYFTHLYNEHASGRARLAEGLRRDRDDVVRYRERHPDLRVVDDRVPIRNVLSPYTYEKGGWILHMLRRVVGDEAFWAGVSTYYRTHRNGNVLSDDFARVMEEASGRDLATFFRQWLYEPGHPRLDVTWRYDPGRAVIDLSVDQMQDAPAFVFDLDVMVGQAGGARRVTTVSVTQRRQAFTIRAADPESLELDPDTWLLFEGTIRRR